MNSSNILMYQILSFLCLPFSSHLTSDNTTGKMIYIDIVLFTKKEKCLSSVHFMIGKIIVYTGWPFENGAYAEIIDLSNPHSLQVFTKMPMLTEIELAFGGKISNDYIYCGGWDGNDYVKECYKIGGKNPFLELIQPRSSGAGVVLPNDTLFITGKPYPMINAWVDPIIIFFQS